MDKSLGTNSHLTRAKPTVRREFIYTCSSVHAISPEFQHCMGGRGGGGKGKQRNLRRKTVLLLNSVLKTQKINAITQVSQGILSTIIDPGQHWNFLYSTN